MFLYIQTINELSELKQHWNEYAHGLSHGLMSMRRGKNVSGLLVQVSELDCV